LALIAPLGKLGRFEEAADYFLFQCKTINLMGGAKRANTTYSAVVLPVQSEIMIFKFKIKHQFFTHLGPY